MADTLRIAAAYIRESTDDQLEYSPEAQRERIVAYAAQHGMILDDTRIYMDGGISGRKADKRPAFQRMIAEAKSEAHPFDVILVWKFSRFARNQEESIVYKSLLARSSVEVVSITEPIIEGPFGSLIERIIEWMDEYYSIRLGEEVKKGMTIKARRGELQATPSFGYRVQDHKLVPHDEEAPLVREIFARFVGGEGLQSIARWLNQIGARTHRGNPFENRTIEYILRNPVYIGKLRWNPAGRSRRSAYPTAETLIIADASHEPLISMETWQAAQDRVAMLKRAYPYHARPASEMADWISGIVRCSNCGSTLVHTTGNYYQCNGYAKGSCRVSHHTTSQRLTDAIIARLTADVESGAPLALDKPKPTQEATEAKRLKAQLSNLQRRRDRLRDAYLAGIEELEDYRAHRAALDAEIAATEAELEAKTIPPIQLLPKLRAEISAALAELTSDQTTIEQKNLAARSIIASCVFDKRNNTLSIVYKA